MIKTAFRHKTFLFLFSIAVTLLTIEAGLRAAGAFYITIRDHDNKLRLNKLNSYRILCIGESTTYLEDDNNYPLYLSEILNSSGLKKTFTVINQGLPGVSTDFIVSHIDSWIDQYKPDLVIVMMGINDDILIARDQRPENPAMTFLKSARLYKLALWISLSAKKRFLKDRFQYSSLDGDPLSGDLASDELSTFRDQAFEQINKTEPEYRKLFKTAMLLEGSEKYQPLAEEIYKTLLSGTTDPKIRKWLYKKIGELLRTQKKYTEFVGLMSDISIDYWGYDWIDPVCSNEAGLKQAESVLQGLIKSRENSSPFYELLALCYDRAGKPEQADDCRQKSKIALLEAIHPATQNNYLKLVRILSEKNITPIFVQYPARNIEPLKKILRPAANFDRLIFVDNEKIFKDVIEQEGYKEYFIDLFAGDFGHCTKKGNRLLAQNIASHLLPHIKNSP